MRRKDNNVSRQTRALRRERLAHSPGDPQRMRDLAIGIVPYAELLGKAGKRAEACAAAADAVTMWDAIRRAGLLGARDANKNVPRAAKLKAGFCN